MRHEIFSMIFSTAQGPEQFCLLGPRKWYWWNSDFSSLSTKYFQTIHNFIIINLVCGAFLATSMIWFNFMTWDVLISMNMVEVGLVRFVLRGYCHYPQLSPCAFWCKEANKTSCCLVDESFGSLRALWFDTLEIWEMVATLKTYVVSLVCVQSISNTRCLVRSRSK